MRLLPATIVGILLAAPLGAQCGNVTFMAYGSSCGNAFPGATLTGTFDPAACNVTVTLNAFGGCCNTFPVMNVYAFGLQQAMTPIPGVPGCFLLNSADTLIQTPPGTDSLTFNVPPGAAGATVYAQAAKVYFTTIGMTTDISATQGLRADFQ